MISRACLVHILLWCLGLYWFNIPFGMYHHSMVPRFLLFKMSSAPPQNTKCLLDSKTSFVFLHLHRTSSLLLGRILSFYMLWPFIVLEITFPPFIFLYPEAGLIFSYFFKGKYRFRTHWRWIETLCTVLKELNISRYLF